MTKRTTFLAAFAGAGVLAAIVARTRESPPRPLDDHEVTPAATPRAEISPPRLAPSPRQRPTDRPRRDGPGSDVVGSTDPTSKNYDPITLMRVMSLTPTEIFNKEPRDPAFAGPREAALRDRLTERLRRRLGMAATVDASCHTSSCEVTVQYPAGTPDAGAALQALELDKLAESMQVGPMEASANHDRAGTSITMLFSSAMRDSSAYDQRLHKHEASDEPAPKTP